MPGQQQTGQYADGVDGKTIVPVNVEKPSRAWYRGYSGVGTVENAMAVTNTEAIIQNPAQYLRAECCVSPRSADARRAGRGLDNDMWLLRFREGCLPASAIDAGRGGRAAPGPSARGGGDVIPAVIGVGKFHGMIRPAGREPGPT
jgi:hypothetical protein